MGTASAKTLRKPGVAVCPAAGGTEEGDRIFDAVGAFADTGSLADDVTVVSIELSPE